MEGEMGGRVARVEVLRGREEGEGTEGKWAWRVAGRRYEWRECAERGEGMVACEKKVSFVEFLFFVWGWQQEGRSCNVLIWLLGWDGM